ncbi:MAG: glucose-6-phosphate isomerase [Hyphomonadaceae bacterium]|nr:glucose-6-phosphate isomerase [Hyphomonadaceae bacterium]
MSFRDIEAAAARLKGTSLKALFGADARRAEAFTIRAPYLTLDLSRQRIDAGALAALKAWAEERDVAGGRDRMFAGEIVNATEGRAARHVALRGDGGPAEVAEGRARMRALAEAFHAKQVIGGAGVALESILHIGIGGSDLGPRLVFDALRPLKRAELRFASNIDGADFDDAIDGLDPKKTLVIVVSKTFTTLETLANAKAARAWIEAAVGKENASKHFAAVSAAPERAKDWAPAERIFPFWDWVGGRYSLWSAVGLSCEIALKDEAFGRMLAGAAAMDAHFKSAPFEANAPMLAAAVQAWNREGLGRASYALVPYARRLELLAAWAQQLEMESNGKRVDRDGRVLPRPSSVVTWGAAGTNAQHSFFQMLHQGVEEIPVEFVLVKDAGGFGRTPLLANALAQAQALMLGRSEEEAFAQMRAGGMDEGQARALAPHRAFPGDRASTMAALDDLKPESLGALLAFFEHRTVAQAFLAGINPFDQFGVELGKEMASKLIPALEGDASVDDAATAAWVARLTR